MNPTPENAAARMEDGHANLIPQILQCLEGRVTAPLTNVTSQTEFAELGVDSLSFIELIVEIEKSFDITLCPDSALDFVTIGDLENYIAENLQK